jgi:hypothetical protein
MPKPITENEKTEMAKNNRQPWVTPQQIEETIVSEHYFSAYEGVLGERFRRTIGETDADEGEIPETLKRLTVCVLVLQNGFVILGQSASATAENFDPEIGQKFARVDAVNQMWPLLGYELKNKLHAEKAPLVRQLRTEVTPVPEPLETPDLPTAPVEVEGDESLRAPEIDTNA